MPPLRQPSGGATWGGGERDKCTAYTGTGTRDLAGGGGCPQQTPFFPGPSYSPMPSFNCSWVLYERGRPNRAAAHYQRAIALKPDFAEAYNNLGASSGLGSNLPAVLVDRPPVYTRAVELAAQSCWPADRGDPS